MVFALPLAVTLGLLGAIHLVLEVGRRALELPAERGRDLPARERGIDSVPKLVGELGGLAGVAGVEGRGDGLASVGEIRRDPMRKPRLDSLGRGAPAARERESRPQGDEGKQRPQNGNPRHNRPPRARSCNG